MHDIRSSYTDSVRFYAGQSPRALAGRLGTPLYVYSEAILRRNCRELTGLTDVPGFTVNYSVKANTNPALLAIVREEGLTVDAMSPGELYMDRLAGFGKDRIFYISNNNSAEEMRAAAEGSCLVSVDSLSQLERFGQVVPGGKVMIRFNPGIGAGHSAKVVTGGKHTKFGVCPEDRDAAFAIMEKHGLTLGGVNQHIGSLFMESGGYLQAVDFLLNFVATFPAAWREHIEVLDFGGGFGIPYRKYEGERRLDLAILGRGLGERFAAWREKTGYTGRFLVEPGRYVAAECGLVLGRVQAVKENYGYRYAGTDIGFNVLVRPVMYDSFHDFEIYGEDTEKRREIVQTITGNICESGDMLAHDRLLPELREGDVIAVLDAGAYGFVMSSTYNQRLRPAEVLITEQGEARLIRRRETFDDLAATLEPSVRLE